MKRKIYQLILAALSALIVTGCYEDDKVWDALNEQQQCLDALEKWQATANANIEALQTLLNTQDYVTAVAPVILDGETVGYTIAFHTHAPVTLYHGAAGPTGPTGTDGPKGETGADGAPPVISVTQAADGNWYWTLNGSQIKDASGNPIRANGHNGTPAPAPQLSTGTVLAQNPDARPVDGTSAQWNPEATYLSVDGGTTWAQVSGKPGKDNDFWFISVDYADTHPDYIIITLKEADMQGNPTTIRVPRYVGFGLKFSMQPLDSSSGNTYPGYLADADPQEIDPNELITLAKDKPVLYFSPRGSGINARDVHVTARIVNAVDGPRIKILTDEKNGTEYAINFEFGSDNSTKYTLLVTATDNAGHSCIYHLEII